MKTLVITGTDTEVGKTILISALSVYWQTYHADKSLGLIKLVQTGIGDRERYQELFGSDSSIEIVTPVTFETPVAPPIAAEREGRDVPLAKVWQALQSLEGQKDFVLAEALGGLGSPVTRELTVADLVREWRLSTVLVVPVKLGAIAQAVANVALARQYKINLKGIILNCTSSLTEQQLADWAPIDLIQSLTYVPVLGILPYLSNINDRQKLAQIASNLDLEQLVFW